MGIHDTYHEEKGNKPKIFYGKISKIDSNYIVLLMIDMNLPPASLWWKDRGVHSVV